MNISSNFNHQWGGNANSPHANPDEIEVGGVIEDSDIGNANKFASQHQDHLKHVNGLGWMMWKGRHWERISDDRVIQFARQTAARINLDTKKKRGENREKMSKWARQSQSLRSLRNMRDTAKSDPRIAREPEDFDNLPQFLNVRNGVIDLATGNLLPHSPGLMITQYTGIEYDPSAKAPTWTQVLSQWMDGNSDMVDFLQRAVGYSLTGDVREQCLFYLYGDGSNGKSTFTEILKSLGGNYWKKTAVETLASHRKAGNASEDCQIARRSHCCRIRDK